MVYPAEWEEAGPENWSVVLCCPNCGHEREGVFTQETVESFDEQLDQGADVARPRLQAPAARRTSPRRSTASPRRCGSTPILPEDF